MRQSKLDVIELARFDESVRRSDTRNLHPLFRPTLIDDGVFLPKRRKRSLIGKRQKLRKLSKLS